MSYCFLLNKTRMEAVLVDTSKADDEYELYDLTPYLKACDPNWSIRDTILLYKTDNISYYTV